MKKWVLGLLSWACVSGLAGQTLLEVGTGLSTAITGAQPGVHVGASLPLGESAFTAGIETGSYFFTTPQWGTYFPIQATLSARFDLSEKATFYLGISPGLGLVSFDNSMKPGGKDYSDTYFSFLIKPSFHLNLTDNQVLVFSPRFGTLNGNLLFAPVVGTAIPL